MTPHDPTPVGSERTFRVPAATAKPRILWPTSFAFALEATLYSAVAPLVPHYAQELAFSHATAGYLVASYAGAQVVGAIVSHRIVRRLTIRTTMLAAVAGLAASSIWFGLSAQILLLIVARAAQGLFSAQLMVSGIAWVASDTPEAASGRSMAFVYGSGTVGTLLGPLLAGLALAIGTAAAFSIIAGSLALLAVRLLQLQEPDPNDDIPTHLIQACASGPLRFPTALLAVHAVTLGFLLATLPLRMVELGASQRAVTGAAFIAAALAALSSLAAGRFADRHGRKYPLLVGLLLGSFCLILLALSTAWLVVSLFTVVFLGVSFPVSVIATMALLTDAGARSARKSLVPTIFMITIALGESIGAAGGAALAEATRVALPLALLTALYLLSIASLLSQRRSSPAG